MKYLSMVILLTTLFSCSTIEYIQPDKELQQIEALQDVDFVKTKLSVDHYDVNWQGRKEFVFNRLDSLGISCNPCSVDEFKSSLVSIIDKIDNGTTTILGITERELKSSKKRPLFSCTLTEDGGIYFKVPNFHYQKSLFETIDKYESLLQNNVVQRIILDLRNNRSWDIENAEYFLERTLQNKTQMCVEQVLKRRNGITQKVDEIENYLLKGFKTSGEYMVASCNTINPRNDISQVTKYVLVDSSTNKGGLLAAYHLKNDGYIAIGSASRSVRNMFTRAASFNLPNSQLYINVSTLRLHLDENFDNTKEDQIIPDIELSEYSLQELLNVIEETEQADFSFKKND